MRLNFSIILYDNKLYKFVIKPTPARLSEKQARNSIIGLAATKPGLEVLALGEFHWTGEGTTIIFSGFGCFAEGFEI